MNVAIIGAGQLGMAFADMLSKTRHGVVFGARTRAAGHDAAERFVQRHGRAVQGGAVADAVRVSDVVVLAVPFDAVRDVAAAAGDTAGKIIVDPTNPLTGEMALAFGFATSAAEAIQALFADAPVVKAFNTIFAELLGDAHLAAPPLQVMLAADDAAAKSVVARITADMGCVAVDHGPLSSARHLEPLGALNIRFAQARGRGPGWSPAWVEAGRQTRAA